MNLQELRQLYHEKKLTDAELKKREEIAQAIAKEHPEMDMSKKMAIATAQAKKVAEEVDSLEEASNYDLVVNYYRHLGLDPYKLRGIVGKALRDKIKASPAFNAWVKLNRHESVEIPKKYSDLIENLKSKKKVDITFFSYPDSANTTNSDSDKEKAETENNFSPK